MKKREKGLQPQVNTTAGKTVPVPKMVESIVGCKWACRLISLIPKGYRRPSELLRACPGLSTKVMNERLRKMLRYGILKKKRFGEKPPFRVEYELTEFGERFAKIIEEIYKLEASMNDSHNGAELEQAGSKKTVGG